MIKNLGFSILYFFSIIIIGTVFITLLNYFDMVNSKFISSLKMFLPIISIAISGFLLGKKSLKKGYIEGIKLGSSIIIFSVLISLLTKTFVLKSLLFYVILLLSAILSSMLGINNRKSAMT